MVVHDNIPEYSFGAAKGFYLFPDSLYAAIVRGVKLTVGVIHGVRLHGCAEVYSTSNIILAYLFPNNLLAQASIVVVFPVPGGPYRRIWGNLLLCISDSTLEVMKIDDDD